MKVELDNIILGYSPLSESVFAGVPLTNGTWRHKIDVTQPFISCVIQKFGGGVTTITDGEHEWEVTVKKIK
jgi:hypothetical protein